MALGFHWRLAVGDAFTPAGGGDLASFLYPYYAFAARSLHQGLVPFWNPYVFSGMPFVGDVQNGLLYPVNLALFLLRPEVTYADMQGLGILHLWLAGGLTYTCLRHLPRLAVGVGPALLGGTAFMFSDLFVMHFGNLNMIAVVAWLPLAFLLFALALERSSLPFAAWSGAVLGISALAGHIQPTIYNGLLLALLAGYETWAAFRRGSPRQALRPLALLMTAGVIAVAVSSPATLPSLVLSRHTPRAEFTYWEASRFSLSPFRALGLVLPDLTGRDPAAYWGLGDRVETGYLGLLPLLLAGFAAWRLSRRPWVGFLTLAAVVSFVLALGDSLPLHGWLFQLVPGLDLLRAPARALYVTDFALAGLAAIGCQALVGSQEAPLRRAVRRYLRPIRQAVLYAAPIALAASLLALLLLQDRDPVIFSRAWTATGSLFRAGLFLIAGLALLRRAPLLTPVRGSAWLAAAIALVYLDLFSAGAYLDLARSNPAASFQREEAVAFLWSDPNPYRVDLDPTAWSAWPPNLGCIYGIEHVRGVANPMELARYRRFLELAQDRAAPLYQLLGAKYLLVAKGQIPPEPNLVPAFAGDPQVDVYLNTSAYPLALVVPTSISATGPEDAATILSAEGFDPTRTVVIEGEGPAVASSDPAAELHFLARGVNHISLSASAQQEAYLFLSLPYAPGWQARLDGQPVMVWPANLAFSAIYLPAGSHTITLDYRPPLFVPSLVAAAVGLVGVIVLTLRAMARQRRSSATTARSD
jgi:hypothetical protein